MIKTVKAVQIVEDESEAARIKALASREGLRVVILASILSETSNFWTTAGKIFGTVFIGNLHLASALAA